MFAPVTLKSPESFVVLHCIRVRGCSSTDQVADTTDLGHQAVDSRLRELRAGGFLAFREGPFGGWILTDAGRQEDAKLCSKELGEGALRHSIQTLYESFLRLNSEVLEICTDWQLYRRPGTEALVPNTHDDADYDATVVLRLGDVDQLAQPICEELGSHLSRLRKYGPRLAFARERVEAQFYDWLTKPTIDSYHSVWFQLHEDLLATLGIARG